MRGIVWSGIVGAAGRLVLLGMPVIPVMPVMAIMVAMAIMAVMAAPVTAQTAFINANGGYQVTKTAFTDTVDFTLYAEAGDFIADYQVAAAPLFDVSGGVMLGRYGAVGVGVSRFRTQDDAAVTARLPHPLFFDSDPACRTRPSGVCTRTVSGTASSLTREEIAVDVQATLILPIARHFDLSLFGGPTFFTVEQDLVTSVSNTETFPFDTTTFDAATAERQSQSGIGFNVGVDFAYFLQAAGSGTRVGLGTLVRFSRGSIDFTSADGGTVQVDAGGVHVAAGLRLRF